MTSPSTLQLGTAYHLFNRGTNRENIFRQKPNFYCFMSLYSKYISPIADTYAYCLLQNHFHLLIRVRIEEEIREALDLPHLVGKQLSSMPSRQFSNLFNAYAKIINLHCNRTGSLFQHPFHRVPIIKEDQYRTVIAYIHHNPQHHGLVKDFREWPFSSYHVLAEKTASVDGEILLTRLNRPAIRSVGTREDGGHPWRKIPLIVDDFA